MTGKKGGFFKNEKDVPSVISDLPSFNEQTIDGNEQTVITLPLIAKDENLGALFFTRRQYYKIKKDFLVEVGARMADAQNLCYRPEARGND